MHLYPSIFLLQPQKRRHARTGVHSYGCVHLNEDKICEYFGKTMLFKTLPAFVFDYMRALCKSSALSFLPHLLEFLFLNLNVNFMAMSTWSF